MNAGRGRVTVHVTSQPEPETINYVKLPPSQRTQSSLRYSRLSSAQLLRMMRVASSFLHFDARSKFNPRLFRADTSHFFVVMRSTSTCPRNGAGCSEFAPLSFWLLHRAAVEKHASDFRSSGPWRVLQKSEQRSAQPRFRLISAII